MDVIFVWIAVVILILWIISNVSGKEEVSREEFYKEVEKDLPDNINYWRVTGTLRNGVKISYTYDREEIYYPSLAEALFEDRFGHMDIVTLDIEGLESLS